MSRDFAHFRATRRLTFWATVTCVAGAALLGFRGFGALPAPLAALLLPLALGGVLGVAGRRQTRIDTAFDVAEDA